MNNAGNPSSRRISAAFLIGFALVLLVAGFIGVQVLSVLYAIILPPRPPLVENAQELSHESRDYGVDEWVYSVGTDACKVALFYAAQEPTCPIPPFCNPNSVANGLTLGLNVSRCGGVMEFSQFKMRWSVNIAVEAEDTARTILRLSREVFWGGQIPPRFEDLMVTPTVTP